MRIKIESLRNLYIISFTCITILLILIYTALVYQSQEKQTIIVIEIDIEIPMVPEEPIAPPSPSDNNRAPIITDIRAVAA